MKIRFMTFNVQHFRLYREPSADRISIPEFADAVRCFNPDILTLNEVRGEGPNPKYTGQTSALAGELGNFAFFAPAFTVPDRNGPAGPYGNAILSRYPLLHPEIVPIPDPADRTPGKGFETRAVGKADVLLPDGRTVTVLTTHFGLNPSEQANAAAVLTGLIDGASHPVILAGDFNVTPENPVLAPIRERLRDTADVLRGEALSFPSDHPDRKIDYVFCSRDLDVGFACIPPLYLSDHRPVLAEFSPGDPRL